MYKDTDGTKLDGKPFRSRWKPALDNLGLSLTGSLLFASRVLLAEGDSDAILVNALIHKLLERGDFNHDVNSLGVMGAGDARDTQALIRILQESAHTAPKLALLFDSDEGGKKREEKVKPLIEDRKIPTIFLEPDNTAIEDHLILASDLFPKAVARYLGQIATEKSEEDYMAELQPSLEACIADPNSPLGLASWSREEGRQVAKLDQEPSSVGIARVYAQLLDEIEASEIPDEALNRAKSLANKIAKELELPSLTLDEPTILAPAPE